MAFLDNSFFSGEETRDWSSVELEVLSVSVVGGFVCPSGVLLNISSSLSSSSAKGLKGLLLNLSFNGGEPTLLGEVIALNDLDRAVLSGVRL